MQSMFDLLVMELKPVYDLPGAWTDTVFRQILQQVEYEEIDDIDPTDLRDMTVMALQDMKSDKVAEAVLEVLLSDRLNAGIRQNLVHEMKEQRMWEEYAQIDCHADLFLTAVLLNQAFPKIYMRPEIARLILQVTAGNTAAAKLLSAPPPALAARLIAAGMDDNSKLHRLYADSLAGGSFLEAASLIWQVNVRSQAAETAEWVLFSSWYWLRPLKGVHTFSAVIKQD